MGTDERSEDREAAVKAAKNLMPLAVQASGGMRAEEDVEDYLGRVGDLTLGLWNETTATSQTVHRLIGRIARDKELAACQIFSGSLMTTQVEGTTNRGILTLQALDKDEPETIRTDRLDSVHGADTYRLAQGLVGQRVLIWKAMEPSRDGSGRKYRCAKHIVGLGTSDAPEQMYSSGQAAPAAAPQQQGSARPVEDVPSPAADPAPEPAANQQPSLPKPVGRDEAATQIAEAVGAHEPLSYRQACAASLLKRALLDDAGCVTNLADLLRLAERAPAADSEAGQKIMKAAGV